MSAVAVIVLRPGSLGTLIPILSDRGELRTRFGTFMLASGAVGEFGPVLILTLVLSAQGTLHNGLILIAFVAVAVVVAVLASRSSIWTECSYRSSSSSAA